MKTCFIVNARSGSARGALPLVREFARSHAAELVLTQRQGHATELARQAVTSGCQLVVAVGGDGTMNEVASALIGSSAVLGLVPCGSGDGLGRCLKIHGPVERALRILTEGTPRLIDTGLADGHPFFTAAGIGFEAEIATRFNRLERRGFVRYLTTSARLLRQWKPEPCTVTADGETFTHEAFTVAVANADQYGNNARIAPSARADDGMLNVTVIPRVTPLNALPLLTRLFNGSIASATGVLSRPAALVTVTRPRPGPLHTDGEVHAAGASVVFRVVPASLRVQCPPSSQSF